MEYQITTIDLLRHGKPEGGEIFRGSTDVAISAEGLAQMQQATQTAEAWQQIISSPMQRCLHFAEQIAAQQKVALAVHEGFKELSFGDWDGKKISDVQQEDPERLKNYWRDPFKHTPPNAEPLNVFSLRVEQALWQIIRQYQGQHMLLVSHGGVIRAILSHILMAEKMSLQRYDVPYASLSRIRIYHDDAGDWPQLVFFNR